MQLPSLRSTLPWVIVSLATGCANMLDYDAITFDDDPGAYSGASTSAECGTMPVTSAACAQCMNDACCTSSVECGTNETCGALATCRLQCPADDIDCLHGCGVDYYQGIVPWKAFDSCLDLLCADVCGP